MPPFVSIIVPCYNEEATIRHLLEAVLAQTYPRGQMELVISDGMSTDSTLDMIAEFQNEHADLAKDLCALFRMKTTGVRITMRII